MKIEGNGANLDPAALQRLERAAADGARGTQAVRQESGDRVEFSSDLALANEAAKAAESAPEIRHDLVERMRALLASGELGSDTGAIADSLIDSMLERK